MCGLKTAVTVYCVDWRFPWSFHQPFYIWNDSFLCIKFLSGWEVLRLGFFLLQLVITCSDGWPYHVIFCLVILNCGVLMMFSALLRYICITLGPSMRMKMSGYPILQTKKNMDITNIHFSRNWYITYSHLMVTIHLFEIYIVRSVLNILFTRNRRSENYYIIWG